MLNTTLKQNLSGFSQSELEKVLLELKWPSFKARQLFSWIYKKPVSDFNQMTDLNKKERDFLKDNFTLSTLKLKEKQVSKDKTIKYLWALSDEKLVESVRMHLKDHDSYSACISSQVGCAVGCPFCATGALGFKRNLKANEIIDQVLEIQRDTKERINNIVFMGQGEPLNNYDEVLKAIQLLKDCVGIGSRHITLSTSGITQNIKKLANEKLQITLAVSLHAPDQETRELLVPISKKYKLRELIETLHYYYDITKRRITIEYVMLNEINDSIQKAKELACLIKNLYCHINLIPYNPIHTKTSINLERPASNKIHRFKEVLEKESHKKVTLRHERGTDIDAACGQLANLAS